MQQEPHRNRGGEMPAKEYGAPRVRAGWVFMTHPTLPDNDPIQVLKAAVPAKEHAGWELVVADEPADEDEDSAGNVDSWQLTEDGD